MICQPTQGVAFLMSLLSRSRYALSSGGLKKKNCEGVDSYRERDNMCL